MKKLLYVVAFCAFGVNASDFDLPRGISSERDIEELKTCYFKGWPHVPRNVDALKQRAIQKVAGDHQAEKAMELFSDCKYLHLVDYCEDHLSDMTDENAQLFREALVLLAPLLSIGNYTMRVVGLIGNPMSITPDYFRNRTLLHDMFCYSAAENARHGHTWIMREMCASICDELVILADEFGWPEHDQLFKICVRDIACGGRRTENRLRANATKVWPNLPDAFTIHKRRQ